MAILGNTEEQRIENSITQCVMDPSTKEGKTVKHFIQNFAVHEKNPQTLTMNIRQFLDAIRDHILAHRKDEFRKMQIKISLSSLIENVLENILLVKLYDKIIKIVSERASSEENKLKNGIQLLRGKPQQFFSIEEKFRSCSDWSLATMELKQIDNHIQPYKMLGCILSAARAIYQSVNLEHCGNQKTVMLSADDFLPIFIYVVVNSGVENMESKSLYLWELSDPQELTGEKGYYLTVFLLFP